MHTLTWDGNRKWAKIDSMAAFLNSLKRKWQIHHTCIFFTLVKGRLVSKKVKLQYIVFENRYFYAVEIQIIIYGLWEQAFLCMVGKSSLFLYSLNLPIFCCFICVPIFSFLYFLPFILFCCQFLYSFIFAIFLFLLPIFSILSLCSFLPFILFLLPIFSILSFLPFLLFMLLLIFSVLSFLTFILYPV